MSSSADDRALQVLNWNAKETLFPMLVWLQATQLEITTNSNGMDFYDVSLVVRTALHACMHSTHALGSKFSGVDRPALQALLVRTS